MCEEPYILLTSRLQCLELAPFDVGGSGDCFFKAVSHQLYNTPDLHLRVRMSAVAHIRENFHLYSDIVTAQGQNWEHYLSQMGTQGTWSDNMIVQAVATSMSYVIYIIHAFVTSDEPIIVYPFNQRRENVIFLGFIPELHYVSTIQINALRLNSSPQNKKIKNLKAKLRQSDCMIEERNAKRRLIFASKKTKDNYSKKQNYFLDFNSLTSRPLEQEQWAIKNILEFQNSVRLNINHCSICSEAWPDKNVEMGSKSYICRRCREDKGEPKLFSSKNGMIPSSVPTELYGLTQTEEMLIAKALPIMNIYLKPGGQRGYFGHCINLPQAVSDVAKSLPRSPKDLALIIVKVKGQNGKMKNLFVRRSVVANALTWLINHNPLYKDVTVNESMIDSLPENGIPIDLQKIETENESCSSTDTDADIPDEEKCYDENTEVSSFFSVPKDKLKEFEAIEQEVSDLTNSIDWPRVENEPLNEYETPFLATMAFPTLFPDGKGDPTNPSIYRNTPFPKKIKHLIKFAEFANGKLVYRFAKHARFSYWALNMIQRKRALQQTGIYLKQNPGDGHLCCKDLDERNLQGHIINKMSRYVANILGSNAYWAKQKDDLKAIIGRKGAGTIFFTFSAADMHWPELHGFFSSDSANLTHLERRQNVIDNPHLIDWYFVTRIESFIKHWLYNTLDAEWHWYRYEFQARGSIHCHGIAKLKNDPGICKLAKVAVDGFKAEKESQLVENSYQMHQTVQDGKKASHIICSYADWLLSTYNPNPPENGNWVKPQTHPCQQKMFDVDCSNDLVNLINTVQRHTRCSANYCLRKTNGSDLKCRFKFPKALCENTQLEFEPRTSQTNNDFKVNVITTRNDPRINNYQPLQLLGWRANCDIQLITSFYDCIEYVTKYAAKREPRSSTVKEMFCKIMKAYDETDSIHHPLQKLVMKTLGEHDFSAQETMHNLLSLKLVSSTFKVIPINLDGSRKIRKFISNEEDEVTYWSLLDYYANRHSFSATDDNLAMNFDQFTITYKICNKKLVSQDKNVIPKFFPQFSSNPKSKHYGQFCKYALIRYKPWSRNINDAWGNGEETEATFIDNWTKFIATDYAKANVIDWTEQIETIQQNIADENTNLEARVDYESCQYNQEDWMQVSNLIQCSSTKQPDINDDWSEGRNNYSDQLIGEMPNWITKHREILSSAPTPQNIDTTRLTTMQQKAYNIIQTHYMVSKSGNKIDSLNLIIIGEAGTGKSFLIFAIRSLLQDCCYTTATTGKAAYNINGITIHSLLKLPLSKRMSKSLTGEALMTLQKKLGLVKYIIIDEYSMLGQKTLAWIDRRCRQATGKVNDVFGGISIILVGDPAQLPPVADKPLYHSSPDDTLSEEGFYAYSMFTKVIKLDRNMRVFGLPFEQKQFLDLLSSLRNGLCSEREWNLILSRQPTAIKNLEDFKYSTRLFFKNDDVAHFNCSQLKKLNKPIAFIEAKHSSEKAKHLPADELCGLQPSLCLAIGTKVMLTLNLWTDTGLCNGATGTIVDIIYKAGMKPPLLPTAVIVCFDAYTGPSICSLPNCVPITPVIASVTLFDGHHERQQLPLKLAWALTIHKSQGLTINKAWIDLGPIEKVPGITYVALSRVRLLSSCVIEPMTLERLQSIGKLKNLKYRLEEEKRLQYLASKTID